MELFAKTLMNVASAGVMSSLLTLAAAPAYAADIHSFVACLNSIHSTRVSDAVACVPSGCKTTVTLSEESAQPACTLRDGTRLPRVIFSCAGDSGSLRFRPSFSSTITLPVGVCYTRGVAGRRALLSTNNSRSPPGHSRGAEGARA